MALTRAIPTPQAILFGFPLRMRALFFRQLATMIHSAVPLGKAVETSGIATFPSLTKEMAGLIQDGNPLSAVMARYPHYFTDYEVALVNTGEYSGSLEHQLSTLAAELEKSYQMKQMLSAKTAYPILVGHAAIFIPPLAIIVTKGFAAYARMTLGVLIPLYIVLGTLWLAYRLSSQAGPVRTFMDRLLIWTPVLSTPVKLMAITRFLRTMAHLQEAGVLPDRALRVACDSCGNAYISARILSTFRNLGDTARFSDIMARSMVFPAVLPPMMASGEESGQLPTMLAKAAEMTRQDLEIAAHRIVTVLPILMLLGVGGVVGYLVINTFTSITSMINL